MQEKVMALCLRVQFFWPSLYFCKKFAAKKVFWSYPSTFMVSLQFMKNLLRYTLIAWVCVYGCAKIGQSTILHLANYYKNTAIFCLFS